MSATPLSGVGVALVTPFKRNLEIDFEGLKRVLDHVANGGVDFLVVMGTTAESPTLDWSEKLKSLEFVCEHCEKLPVVFGHGGNNTRDLIQKLPDLKNFPLTALLSTSPYYNKPSQEGIYTHYSAIADESPFPLILYNVPGRTASNISADTTIKLSQHPNITGTKEAAGDLDQCKNILKNAADSFQLFCGDDALTLPMMRMGAVGSISVIANFLPQEYTEMVHWILSGDLTKAEKMDAMLNKGYELMLQEGNPVSVKKGLETLGLIHSDVRLPLVKGSDSLGQEFKTFLNQLHQSV